jgi:hypothetical protein
MFQTEAGQGPFKAGTTSLVMNKTTIVIMGKIKINATKPSPFILFNLSIKNNLLKAQENVMVFMNLNPYALFFPLDTLSYFMFIELIDPKIRTTELLKVFYVIKCKCFNVKKKKKPKLVNTMQKSSR